ncbi:hypothetical protein SISNIDRAFT_490457 [Sistotremastrum niveocremeum HHB9708]|uniref:DUF6593 domain-containing protein n=1 Tax=Sistotremastrum niveocremeum HHB9708 TaxID=1314777 RepID=A0A164NWJ8_9AGAM|nr:hypothetical protein SISNIDRAFT_490457 [Sistotremastrum niveocremeum HHB9708]
MSHNPYLSGQSVDTLPAYRDYSRTENDDGSDTSSIASESSTFTVQQPTLDADPSSSGSFTLSFDGINVKQDTIRAPGGQIMYTSTCRGDVNSNLLTCLKDKAGNNIGQLMQIAMGTDQVVLGNDPPLGRKSWLKPGMPFSKTLGSFKYSGLEYKWIQAKDPNQITLELYEKNSKTLIARYRDSRRDWAIPLPEVVIHRAKMEIFASGLHMINIIMFSFLVTEILRRDRSPDVMDLATANNVARIEGAYSIFA